MVLASVILLHFYEEKKKNIRDSLTYIYTSVPCVTTGHLFSGGEREYLQYRKVYCVVAADEKTKKKRKKLF